MNRRSSDLTPYVRSFLEAARLLSERGIAPLTRRRVAAIQSLILGFDVDEVQMRGAFEELGDLGFVRSAEVDDEIVVSSPEHGQESEAAHPALFAAENALVADAMVQIGDLEALHTLALALFSGRDYQAALDVHDAMLRWLDAHPRSDLPRERVRDLTNRASCLAMLERSEDALAAYDDVIERFLDNADPEIPRHVASALFGRGFALSKLQRVKEAVTTLLQVDTRFGSATEPRIRATVVKALGLRAKLEFESGYASDAFDIYRSVESRFSDELDPAVREAVARTAINHGRTLGIEGRLVDQLICYRRLDERFGADLSDDIRTIVVLALVERSQTLARLNRDEEAASQYRDAHDRYWNGGTPEMRATLETGGAEIPALASASFQAGDIDWGWIPSSSVPQDVVAAAANDFRQKGPEEFRDASAEWFGWQQLRCAPRWWLIRVVPRSKFWGYGLYCLWTPGHLLQLRGAGAELGDLARRGYVRIESPEAAWEWYRLKGACELVAGFPKYSLVEPSTMPKSDVFISAAAVVRPHEQGWKVEATRTFSRGQGDRVKGGELRIAQIDAHDPGRNQRLHDLAVPPYVVGCHRTGEGRVQPFQLGSLCLLGQGGHLSGCAGDRSVVVDMAAWTRNRGAAAMSWTADLTVCAISAGRARAGHAPLAVVSRGPRVEKSAGNRRLVRCVHLDVRAVQYTVCAHGRRGDCDGLCPRDARIPAQ
jgi:tetratricopeptide (TPR) repeat protein